MTDQNSYTNPNQPKKSDNKAILIVMIALLLLLLGAAGFLGFQYIQNAKVIEAQKKENVKLTEENTKINTELTDLKKKFEDLRGENEQLTALANERLARIEDLEKQIRRCGTGGSGSGGGGKFKRELEKLKIEYAELKARYDKLVAENATLKDANTKLNQDLVTTKQQNEQLTVTNKTLQEKVDLAALLKVSEIKGYAVQVKKSGGEKVTDKAKKANKIEACFKIFENNVTEPGDKEVVMIIKDPNGKYLSKGPADKIEYMGTEIGFAAKKSFYYSNKSQDLCLAFSAQEALTKGSYKIEVYIDGVQSAKSTFDLK